MKTFFTLPAIAAGVLLLTSAALAQSGPAQNSPAAPPATGQLYFVPGQILPINSATGMLQYPPEIQAKLDKSKQSDKLCTKAIAEAARGDWAQALPNYQQALTLDPENPIALYGMVDFSVTEGDTQAAIGYYRQVIYAKSQPPNLPTFRDSTVYRLMDFAILLSQSGQQEEAVRVYQQAAHTLNYNGDKPKLTMMFPEFGDGPGQIAFTPKRLQALADVGWVFDHVDFDRAGARKRLQEAVELYPDSPVVYFYRARHAATYREAGSNAPADFDRAAQLSNPAQKAAVQIERDFFFELPVKVTAAKSPQ